MVGQKARMAPVTSAGKCLDMFILLTKHAGLRNWAAVETRKPGKSYCPFWLLGWQEPIKQGRRQSGKGTQQEGQRPIPGRWPRTLSSQLPQACTTKSSVTNIRAQGATMCADDTTMQRRHHTH